ncbi:hypothetical protein BD413DRAFT_626316 [Trametes elegans]|nr:hypothetical protein BD413DRAFT_626316 [Trametes elegans]
MNMPLSQSQDSLPLYSEQLEHNSPGSYSLVDATKLFLVLGGPAAPRYTRLPTSGSDEEDVDLEKGELTPVKLSNGPSAPTTPPSAAATAPAPSHAPADPATPTHPRLTVFQAAVNAVWFARMLILLLVAGAAAAVPSSLLGFVLGMVTVFHWLAPFSALPFWTGCAACATGASVLGAAAGLAGWAALCVRRAREARRRAGGLDSLAAAREDRKENAVVGAEPREVWGVAGAGVAVGAFGMAVGMALVPALRAAGAEAGFGFGHALGVGVWGATVPLLPGIVGALWATLASCDPLQGFGDVCGFFFFPCRRTM